MPYYTYILLVYLTINTSDYSGRNNSEQAHETRFTELQICIGVGVGGAGGEL
jgi:hypothetical protein